MDNLETIENWFHDVKIQCETAAKCGKIHVHLDVITEIVRTMELLTQEIRKIDGRTQQIS